LVAMSFARRIGSLWADFGCRWGLVLLVSDGLVEK
jgi:hypothetical protein